MAESRQASKPVPAPAAPRPHPSAIASFRRELLYVTLTVAAGALVGWLLGGWLYGAAAALAAQLGRYLAYMRALRVWVDSPKRFELPEPEGIWGDVFESLLALQRSNRRRKKKLAGILSEFQASTAALPDGAVVLGEQGEIVWFNKAAQALLGLHVAQDLGIRVANLIRHPAFAEYLADVRYEGEVEVPSPVNLKTTLALRIIPYGNNQRLLIVRDVSELRQLEVTRRDFVANASHELRTPLTVMRGYLDMIEPETRKSGEFAIWQMPITEMRNQAVRMESVVNDMLKLARLESTVYDATLDMVDVPRLAQRALDEAASMSRGEHHFEAHIDPDLRLFGRETEAQSIFSNLTTNAVRYTPAGGRIVISWREDSEGAHFEVTDSGIGIAEEDIPRLTERFYRVDVGRSRASGGTGLGLSIVKHALERHEGRLEIRSQIGIGSQFLCHFPLHRICRIDSADAYRALAG